MVLTAAGATLRVIPTYENASVYVEGEKLDPSTLRISYREKGSEDWWQGHALTASENDAVPRGSIFGLREHTRYEVRCQDAGGKLLAEADFETWMDNPPIAQTINLRQISSQGGPVVIDKSGSPDGWIRYVAGPDFIIDGGQLAAAAILIRNAHHIILEGITVRGGQRHGILLQKSHDVRIRNCDIAGFGRVGVQDLTRGGKYYMPGDSRPVNWDAGVCVDLSGNITVERSFIHDPRGRANSWFFSHPAGPNAVYVRSTGGMVLRDNDFVAGENHRWNDAVEGYGNGDVDGGFNCDSDIYGNFFAFANDDGIELDGGQCNVRCYGNKIEGGLCGISTAANRRGPSYVFGNLVVNLSDERGCAGAAIKNGGGPTYSQGTTYFYHNTFLTFGQGIAAIGYGSDKGLRGMFLGYARNNVLATSGPGINDPVPSPPKSYDHDFFAGAARDGGEYNVLGEVEAHGLVGDSGFVDAGQGVLALAPGSPAKEMGERVPGLSAIQREGAPIAAGIWFDGTGPLRPCLARLDHGQLFLIASGTDAHVRRTVQLRSLASSGGKAQPFRILQNDAPWLKVEPSSGALKPGESLPLSVEFDASGCVGPGLQFGAAIVKFADGYSLPLPVYATVSASPLRCLFEAESLPGSQQFSQVVEASASGGAALRLDPASAKDAHVLTLTFNVPASGAYYLAVRTRSPQPYASHDSIFVSINGGQPQIFAVTGAEQWTWSRLASETMHINLPAGSNRISFAPREDLYLDAILVSDRPLMAADKLSDFLRDVPSTP